MSRHKEPAWTIKKSSGMTLLEVIIALGIFAFLVVVLVALLINGFRYNNRLWDNLEVQGDLRQALAWFRADVRVIEPGAGGIAAVERAQNNEFIFYADVVGDTTPERVRYILSGTELNRGVVKATGVPLRYNTSTESQVTIAQDVVNIAKNVPMISYFDNTFTGSGAPLTQPVSTSTVTGVRLRLMFEKPNVAPLDVSTFVTLRNR